MERLIFYVLESRGYTLISVLAMSRNCAFQIAQDSHYEKTKDEEVVLVCTFIGQEALLANLLN